MTSSRPQLAGGRVDDADVEAWPGQDRLGALLVVDGHELVQELPLDQVGGLVGLGAQPPLQRLLEPLDLPQVVKTIALSVKVEAGTPKRATAARKRSRTIGPVTDRWGSRINQSWVSRLVARYRVVVVGGVPGDVSSPASSGCAPGHGASAVVSLTRCAARTHTGGSRVGHVNRTTKSKDGQLANKNWVD
jgi:hypothetical protein